MRLFSLAVIPLTEGPSRLNREDIRGELSAQQLHPQVAVCSRQWAGPPMWISSGSLRLNFAFVCVCVARYILQFIESKVLLLHTSRITPLEGTGWRVFFFPCLACSAGLICCYLKGAITLLCKRWKLEPDRSTELTVWPAPLSRTSSFKAKVRSRPE